MFDLAERSDGPCIRPFQALAGHLETCLCFWFAERVGSAVQYSAVFIDHLGRVSRDAASTKKPFSSLSTAGRPGPIVACAAGFGPPTRRSGDAEC